MIDLELAPRIVHATTGGPAGRFATLIVEAAGDVALYGHYDSLDEAWRATGLSLGGRRWLVAKADETTLTVYSWRDRELGTVRRAAPPQR